MIHLQQSKTDPFGARVTLYLARTGNVLCPVALVLADLTIWQATLGPMFIFRDDTPLFLAHLVTAFQQALQVGGFDIFSHSGHCFRIEAATTAAEFGLSDSLIKTLGRWKSAAYATYIKTPRECLMPIPSVCSCEYAHKNISKDLSGINTTIMYHIVCSLPLFCPI